MFWGNPYLTFSQHSIWDLFKLAFVQGRALVCVEYERRYNQLIRREFKLQLWVLSSVAKRNLCAGISRQVRENLRLSEAHPLFMSLFFVFLVLSIWIGAGWEKRVDTNICKTNYLQYSGWTKRRQSTPKWQSTPMSVLIAAVITSHSRWEKSCN